VKQVILIVTKLQGQTSCDNTSIIHEVRQKVHDHAALVSAKIWPCLKRLKYPSDGVDQCNSVEHLHECYYKKPSLYHLLVPILLGIVIIITKTDIYHYRT